MKKIVTLAALAGGALALAACSGETAKKTAEDAAAAEAAPAEAEAAPAEAAAAAPATEEELDPTGNPIGMDKPAEPADAMAAE